MLESVMLDEAAQNLIETVDMFKPYTKPFESKEIGKYIFLMLLIMFYHISLKE